MYMQADTARTGLEEAIAALARDIRRLTTDDACARIGRLRRQAVAHGYLPTAAMADGLADALRRDGRAAPLQSWLDALSLAAGCGTGSPDTTPALFATVGVRFAA
jgi:hypothetical protein